MIQRVPITNCRKICRNKNCDNEQLKTHNFCYHCLRFPGSIHQIDSIQLYEVIDDKYYVVDDK